MNRQLQTLKFRMKVFNWKLELAYKKQKEKMKEDKSSQYYSE